MTRKDYELIARSFAFTLEGLDLEANAGARFVATQLAENLASALAHTNDRFDRQRFVTACKVEQLPTSSR